jgi:SWI/SNF-related matrix-associated actin-dependent regulator of chromatin subfamily A3
LKNNLLNVLKMGLGKTITCVALMAATYNSALEFAHVPVECAVPRLKPSEGDSLSAAHFANSVWGVSMTNLSGSSSNGNGKRSRQDTKAEADYARARRIKLRSRATLIICPLSTVSNWEDQIREHWNGPVTIIGGGSCVSSSAVSSSTGNNQRSGHPMRICIYHGNARRAEPEFLADFDAVITTFSTLATEYSKQTRSIASSEECTEEDIDEDFAWLEAGTAAETAKSKAHKRKKCTEITSALQSVHWFRVVLDEAQYVFTGLFRYFYHV